MFPLCFATNKYVFWGLQLLVCHGGFYRSISITSSKKIDCGWEPIIIHKLATTHIVYTRIFSRLIYRLENVIFKTGCKMEIIVGMK